MARLGEHQSLEDVNEELNEFDPWEHLYEEEEEFQPIKPKAKKIKKMKKERPFSDKKRK